MDDVTAGGITRPKVAPKLKYSGMARAAETSTSSSGQEIIQTK
jgi:hypothetical protein